MSNQTPISPQALFFCLGGWCLVWRQRRHHNIIGSLFTLCKSSCLSDLPFRSWISHGENSKRQPSSFRNPLLMSLWGTDGMGYQVKELPLQLIWAFIFSSATLGSLRTPYSSLHLLFLHIINSSARNFWCHLGKWTDFEKVIWYQLKLYILRVWSRVLVRKKLVQDFNLIFNTINLLNITNYSWSSNIILIQSVNGVFRLLEQPHFFKCFTLRLKIKNNIANKHCSDWWLLLHLVCSYSADLWL